MRRQVPVGALLLILVFAHCQGISAQGAQADQARLSITEDITVSSDGSYQAYTYVTYTPAFAALCNPPLDQLDYDWTTWLPPGAQVGTISRGPGSVQLGYLSRAGIAQQAHSVEVTVTPLRLPTLAVAALAGAAQDLSVERRSLVHLSGFVVHWPNPLATRLSTSAWSDSSVVWQRGDTVSFNQHYAMGSGEGPFWDTLARLMPADIVVNYIPGLNMARYEEIWPQVAVVAIGALLAAGLILRALYRSGPLDLRPRRTDYAVIILMALCGWLGLAAWVLVVLSAVGRGALFSTAEYLPYGYLFPTFLAFLSDHQLDPFVLFVALLCFYVAWTLAHSDRFPWIRWALLAASAGAILYVEAIAILVLPLPELILSDQRWIIAVGAALVATGIGFLAASGLQPAHRV